MPEHWELVRLGKLGRLVRGVSYKKQDVTNDAILRYLPVLRATNIQDRQLILDEELVYVKAEKVSDSQLLRRGDVIIAMSSGSKSVVGKAAQLNMDWKGSFGAFCAVFRHNAMAESFFVGNVFQTKNFRKHLLREARGTNINNLSKNHILDYQLLLPPLPEQRAIASILGAIQEAKFARQKEIALERERKAALMDYLFSHGTKDERRKQTEIGEIPESWQLRTIQEVCDKIIDYRGKTPQFVDSGVVHLRSSNVKEGSLALNQITYVSEETYVSFMKRGFPKADDVIFTTEGPLGESAMVPPNFRFSLAQRMIVLRVKEKVLNPCFLLFVLYSEQVKKDYFGRSTGSTVKGISSKSFQQVQVPLPSLSEQRKIANVFTAVDARIAALEHETARQDELFHAMLEELMTGKRSAIPLIDVDLPN